MTCTYLGDAGGREGENAAGTFLISELATKTNSKNNPTNRGPPPHCPHSRHGGWEPGNTAMAILPAPAVAARGAHTGDPPS